MIELVIVIALIGIIYSVVVTPRTSTLSTTTSLKTAAKQIKSDISLARERAMHSGLKQRVVFSAGTSTYTFYQESIGADTWGNIGQALPLSSGVVVSSTSFSDNQLVYNAYAVPHDDPQSDAPSEVNAALSASKTITLSRNNSTITIYVVPETGYVHID